MSNQFYKYLSEKIIKYFQINKPQSGDKFYIQFETEDQVKNLYSELGKNTIASEYAYIDEKRDQKYKSYQLLFGDVGLIVAASMTGGPHPDFLATLRNLVGMADEYKDKAILFVHCSSLDSILGGAGSLAKEGMPLNISAIERDIQRKIGETGYSVTDKTLLEYYLDNKRKELDGATASIFEYEGLICSLKDSHISREEYRIFELFYDELLNGLPPKKIRERLEVNHENYVRVSEIHSYGIDDTKLEKYYGENGLKALKKDNWEEVTFHEIEKYIASKKNNSTIEYIPILSDLMIWDKEEGASKAKSRIRNILVFATSEEEVVLTLTFTEHTKKLGIEIPKVYQSTLKCESTGKKLIVELSGIEDTAAFYHFKYTDDGAKFEFKIAVLRCPPALLSRIKTQYSIEMKGGIASAIRINTDEDEVVINDYAPNRIDHKITEIDQVVQVKSDEMAVISVGEDYPYSEDNEDVLFVISTESFSIPIIKAFAVEKPTVIEGLKLWYLKRIMKSSFEMMGDNSLVLGTKRYFARDEFKKSLDIEKKYILSQCPLCLEKNENATEIEGIELKLPDSVRLAFAQIIAYFISNKSIPSLSYVDEELESLYNNLLSAICEELKSVAEGSYLSEEIKNIFYIGMIKRQYGDFEILLSPLHPINIAYQIYINKQNIDGLEENDIDLLRKFQHTALLPYINIDPYSKENKVYIPIEQTHSPEWKVYVEENLPRYKGSKDFVSKLVAEKIQEFVEHFSYLFSKDANAPLRINLINTGDCREIVQGIFKYIIKELNSYGKNEIIPMHITMYSSTKMDTAFTMVSQIDNAELLASAIGIDVRSDNLSIEDIIDIYRRKVYFYYKDIEDSFDYSHITFMELDDDNQAISTLMQDIPSGIVMNGISSGVPSELLGDTYRTGFGIKYANTDNMLIKMAIWFNSINAAMNGDTYRSENCYALKMSANKHKILERVYDASNWVTFINPKVDLNYFRSDLDSKDLLIIHYSDQYNMTSSGYDSITVTKKSKQYQTAISRYLSKNGVEEADMHSKRIINMFNALNGDWLLRMLSYKSHFPVEKLSILSAMKVAVKRYAIPGVIWVPVSLEEILRVSGSVGLSQSGSIFSAKNLGFVGSTSDDLLLVGIKSSNAVQISFYPIEVKIGKIASDYLEKGIMQALKTRQIFDEILEFGPCKDKSIKTRLYRNFFVQQLLVNAEKMLLYNVGDGTQGWEQVTRSELRMKLLSEDYEIVPSFVTNMGSAGVFSFREDCNKEREYRTQDVLVVEKTKTEGVNLLAKEFKEIDSVEWELVKDETEEVYIQDDCSDENDEKGENSDIPVNTETPDEPKTSELLVDNIGSSDLRVLIGKDKYLHDVYWEFGNKALANRHLLITGTSGQGKTYSIQTMLYELVQRNISAVIFDYTEGFMLQQLEEPFKEVLGEKINQQVVYNTGVPINPFKRHEVELVGQKVLEKESVVAARVADIFSHVYDFGAQQYSAIFDAAFNGLKKYGDNMNMIHFQEELNEVSEENKTAKSVISKMSPFFHTVEFTNDLNFKWDDMLYADDSRINIVQLALFSRDMQVIITEMMLWDAWYYTKKYGSQDKPFVVVLDEAQNLSHTMKSPSAAILTEGRKFGWSAWFATQSLKVLKDDEVVRLLQASFKLYFKPTDDEMIKIAKQLDVSGEYNWLPELQKLKKGQCITVGAKMKPNGTVGPAAPAVTNITSFEERKS